LGVSCSCPAQLEEAILNDTNRQTSFTEQITSGSWKCLSVPLIDKPQAIGDKTVYRLFMGARLFFMCEQLYAKSVSEKIRLTILSL
jgi:hypothetical protein